MYLPCIPPILLRSPDSNKFRFFFDALDRLLSVPKILPKVGMKINATSNDELKTANRVTGKKNINSPAIPGQNIRGKRQLELLMLMQALVRTFFVLTT